MVVITTFTNRRKTSIAVWLVVIVLIILIHPLFDIAHAQTSRAVSAPQLALLLVGFSHSLPQISAEFVHAQSRPATTGNILQLFCLLLC
jgi:hypothetical protein